MNMEEKKSKETRNKKQKRETMDGNRKFSVKLIMFE